jgi:hypothetical protein
VAGSEAGYGGHFAELLAKSSSDRYDMVDLAEAIRSSCTCSRDSVETRKTGRTSRQMARLCSCAKLLGLHVAESRLGTAKLQYIVELDKVLSDT